MDKNLTQAMELYEEAAEKGIADAYNGLGFAAFYGSEGEFEANKTLAFTRTFEKQPHLAHLMAWLTPG